MTEARAERLMNVITENTGLLAQGVELITSIDPELYANNSHEYFSSGVGKHFRHVLDFYDRFLGGHRSTVDYEARSRDARIESDPEYAASRAADVSAALDSLAAPAPVDSSLRVRCEILDANGDGIESASSLERELAFLSSHTVHHYAIIALLLRVQGVKTPADFGVAPSTLRYRASQS